MRVARDAGTKTEGLMTHFSNLKKRFSEGSYALHVMPEPKRLCASCTIRPFVLHHQRRNPDRLQQAASGDDERIQRIDERLCVAANRHVERDRNPPAWKRQQ